MTDSGSTSPGATSPARDRPPASAIRRYRFAALHPVGRTSRKTTSASRLWRGLGFRRRLLPLSSWLLRFSAPDRTPFLSEYPIRPEVRWGWGNPSHPELEALIAAGEDRYARVIDRLLGHLPELGGVSRIADLPEPSWDNDYWAGLDAAVHMIELLDRNPATYLEIGSGYSTVLARHAISAHGLRTRIVSIDPFPRAEVDRLCDVVIRRPLEQVGGGVSEELEPGDVVVIDGSHVALMGTDATVAPLELLPRIPPGVLVGIDDVFLPWDYHPTWAGRYYSEQYVLAGFRLGGAQGWEITFPGLYVAMLSPLASRLAPLWRIVETHFGRVAGTLWMERTPGDR